MKCVSKNEMKKIHESVLICEQQLFQIKKKKKRNNGVCRLKVDYMVKLLNIRL